MAKLKCSTSCLHIFSTFSSNFLQIFQMTKLDCFHHRSTNVCKNTVKVKAAFCSNEFLLCNNFCRCFTQVFVLSTKQDSAHNFLSSTLGSRFGSGSWPLSLVSDTEPIVGSGLKSTRDRLRDQTDSKSISKRSLRHKGMDNISNLKPIQF